MKKLVIFDLDGTLAESKSALDAEMATLLQGLLAVTQVAVISGGDWSQFQKQLLANLPRDERWKRLSLLPTCGTKFMRFEGEWTRLYSEDFSDDEKKKILHSFDQALAQSGFKPEQMWGELIEDRGSQITFSALGQQAPHDVKKHWDPDFAKRKKIQAILQTLAPEFSIRLGGATSIDVTKAGIDKAYGINKLSSILGIPLTEMLFIGDAIFPGGNDYPAKEAGVDCIQVRDVTETKRTVEAITACLK
jgi:phosphomannomutase